MLSSVSRGHAALRGGVALLLGSAFLVWPDVGTGTFVALFALYCLVDAGVALTRLANATPRWPLALRTFVDLAAAFVAIAYPDRTAGALAAIVGLYLIVLGLGELSSTWVVAHDGRSGPAVAAGLISVVAGASLVLWPGLGLAALAALFGAILVVSGVLWLAAAARAQDGALVAPPRL